ncbi:hypothetical protein [Streptomyces sp. OE57]|uniref:hypothetical protein n=1 Tax=Streptomyces lacaronensis TaxID=3379885 RepID=UPI0039B761B2
MSSHLETVVLDSQGLSAWVAQDRKVLAMFQVFHEMGADLVVRAEAALRQPPPVAVVTSDTDDMAKLCDDRVRLIAL